MGGEVVSGAAVAFTALLDKFGVKDGPRAEFLEVFGKATSAQVPFSSAVSEAGETDGGVDEFVDDLMGCDEAFTDDFVEAMVAVRAAKKAGDNVSAEKRRLLADGFKLVHPRRGKVSGRHAAGTIGKSKS